MSKAEALSFSTFIASQEDGQLHADLTDAVREIVAELNNAVMEHGGVHSADLGIALSFKIDGGPIEVKAEVKKVLPKERRPRTITGQRRTISSPGRIRSRRICPFRTSMNAGRFGTQPNTPERVCLRTPLAA